MAWLAWPIEREGSDSRLVRVLRPPRTQLETRKFSFRENADCEGSAAVLAEPNRTVIIA